MREERDMPADPEDSSPAPITPRQPTDAEPAHDPSHFDPAAAYLERLGEGSRRTMREALAKLADWASEGRCGPHELAWHNLRIEHTSALRTRLTTTLAPATANKHLAALRGVLKQSWQRGLMSTDAYQRAIDLPPVRGRARRKSNRLGALELRKLAQACSGDSSPAGARDEALLALLFGANLRRSQAVALELADYDLTSGVLDIRAPGGRPSRRFETSDEARRSLERWIGIRGSGAGPLFNPVNKGGRIERRSLSEQAIYIACQKRAAEAGLPPTSPEDLRRADVTTLSGQLGTPAGPRPSFGSPGPA
jgi:integrase